MPEAQASGGCKATGSAEIRDSDGNLLVAFNSEDVKDYWGNRYQVARIKYAMLKRREQIPSYLRTGKRPHIAYIPILGKRIATLLLERKLKQGGN